MNAGSLRSPTNLAAIFGEHFDYVWATLRRPGVREADREDLVHDVFMNVHSRLADFDECRSIRAWLFGFAYRVAADYQRLARHRVEVLGALDDAASDRPSAEERIASIELRDVVLDALQMLDLDRRALLVMHHIHEIPVPQLAQHGVLAPATRASNSPTR